MDFITQLVPPPFRADRKVFRRARLILKIDFIIFLFSLFFIPFYNYIGFSEGIWVMLFAFVCSISFPILLHVTKSLDFSGHFFAFASLSTFMGLIGFTGGVHSPYFVWLLSMPPITILYMRPITAYVWLTIFAVAILTIFGFEFTGTPLPDSQAPQWFAPTLLFSLSMVTLICISVVHLFLNGFRRFNKKLKDANQSLQESNKELERFAYIASHDLKSPLRNIVSFVNLIERRYSDQLDKNGNDYLEIVKTNARQMHHLVEDILEYSQTNNMELEKKRIDLEKILHLLTTQLQSNEAYASSKIIVDEIPNLNADPATMNQLFQNLIENGLKYNDSKIPTIKIKFEHKHDTLHFKIIDNGIGIEQAYQDNIFEMFKRLHNHSTYEGTGIGLAICKKIIHLYHGKISVSSEVGKGSIFHIRFPDSMLYTENIEEEEVQEELGVV